MVCLYWLQRAATSRDLSVIFLSGHGVRDAKQNFWFLTREADIERSCRTTAISNDDLLDLIASIPGKKVLFIDACHAGAAMPVGYQSDAWETTPRYEQGGQRFHHRWGRASLSTRPRRGPKSPMRTSSGIAMERSRKR